MFEKKIVQSKFISVYIFCHRKIKNYHIFPFLGKIHKKLGNTDLALMHFSWATDLDPKGASSQIKEAFDPSIARNSTDIDLPASPALEDYQSESNSAQRSGALNFSGLPEDSEDSF